jgi:lysyl endopeptidase
MRLVRLYRLILLSLVFTGVSALYGQVEVPGKILDDPAKGDAARSIYLLPPPDPLEIESRRALNAERASKNLQYAIMRAVDLNPESHGIWRKETVRIWRVHIISPGARSLGLVFDQFHLREGVKLMVYDPSRRQVRGAYSAVNNKNAGGLAVGHTTGEEVILELQVPAGMYDYGRLSLSAISHAFIHPSAVDKALACPGEYGCAGDCEIDVNCEQGSEWQTEKRSIIRVNTLTQYCTGVIVNNTLYNGDPLVLTAKHCIDKDTLAKTALYEFGYESPSCEGGDGNLDRSISSAELLAVGDSIDFCLLRLSTIPPASYEAYYAGWSREMAQSEGTHAIHHPEGDVKKISFDKDAPELTNDGFTLPREFEEYIDSSFWQIRRWDFGTTERGSSGSPVFNSQRQVYGLLSWGYADCVDPVDDFYTRFDMAWDYNEEPDQSLKSWLDPASSDLMSLGGYQPSSIGKPALPEPLRYALYPNPASGKVYLEQKGSLHEEIHCRIFDAGGRLLRHIHPGMGERLEVHVGDLLPGIYFLEAGNGSWSEYHKLVVE